ncbi:MAG: YbaN family protein [Pseudomonadota bacterium]
MRYVWLTFGCLSVALGLAGVVLPLLPTVPFMLLAAFCFARSSPRLHDWLVEHPRFGPAIEDWRRHGAVSRRGKRLATWSVALAFFGSVFFGAPAWVLGTQAVALSGVMLFLWTRPEGPEGDEGVPGAKLSAPTPRGAPPGP